MNSDYNEKSSRSSQHVHSTISSKPDPQDIFEVNVCGNAQDISASVGVHTNSHSSINHNQPVYVSGIETVADCVNFRSKHFICANYGK